MTEERRLIDVFSKVSLVSIKILRLGEVVCDEVITNHKENIYTKGNNSTILGYYKFIKETGVILA